MVSTWPARRSAKQRQFYPEAGIDLDTGLRIACTYTKALLSIAVTEGVGFNRGEREKGLKLSYLDVQRADFYAKAKKCVFIKWVEEEEDE